MVHLALGSRESYDDCLHFIRDIVRRGLRVPVLITTDGAPGLIRAADEVWPKSLRQRCLAHKDAAHQGALHPGQDTARGAGRDQAARS